MNCEVHDSLLTWSLYGRVANEGRLLDHCTARKSSLADHSYTVSTLVAKRSESRKGEGVGNAAAGTSDEACCVSLPSTFRTSIASSLPEIFNLM